METNVTSAAGRTVIHLEGRFDFSVHRQFRETVDVAFKNAGGGELVVDLGSVDYMDSSALGMLLVLRDRARSANRTVSLINAQGAVKQVLEIANFSKLFTVT